MNIKLGKGVNGWDTFWASRGAAAAAAAVAVVVVSGGGDGAVVVVVLRSFATKHALADPLHSKTRNISPATTRQK